MGQFSRMSLDSGHVQEHRDWLCVVSPSDFSHVVNEKARLQQRGDVSADWPLVMRYLVAVERPPHRLLVEILAEDVTALRVATLAPLVVTGSGDRVKNRETKTASCAKQAVSLTAAPREVADGVESLEGNDGVNGAVVERQRRGVSHPVVAVGVGRNRQPN